MIEPEIAFTDLEGNMANAEAFVKHVVKYAMDTCPEDLKFFNDFYDKTLLERLTNVVEKPFGRIEYKDAIVALQEEIKKDPSAWQFPDVEFGTDLQVRQVLSRLQGLGARVLEVECEKSLVTLFCGGGGLAS
jgi:asparaginyl-tRNA synthetase